LGYRISTAIFYSKNYQKVYDFINNLSENTKSKAVDSLKTLISLNDLSNQFIELSELEFLIDSINKLETGGLRLKEQLDILENVKSKLTGSLLIKLNSSLAKNPDLIGFTKDDNTYDHKLKTKYTPINKYRR